MLDSREGRKCIHSLVIRKGELLKSYVRSREL